MPHFIQRGRIRGLRVRVVVYLLCHLRRYFWLFTISCFVSIPFQVLSEAYWLPPVACWQFHDSWRRVKIVKWVHLSWITHVLYQIRTSDTLCHWGVLNSWWSWVVLVSEKVLIRSCLLNCPCSNSYWIEMDRCFPLDTSVSVQVWHCAAIWLAWKRYNLIA